MRRLAAMRVASLPWYDLPEIRRETDRLWARLAEALRERGVADVPERLDRESPLGAQWRSGDLLFGQCCGLDVASTYAGGLQPVAAPTYAGSRAGPGRYRSLVLVRASFRARSLEHLRNSRCVVNGCSSHSGMSVLRAMVAPLHRGGRFFRSVEVTGSHVRSLERLHRGLADVAAIDSVLFALLARHRPSALAGLRVVQETPCAPAPPFVTSARATPEEVEMLRSAIRDALADPALAGARQALLLDGALAATRASYQPLLDCEREALARGYCLLRTEAAA